jgi:molybdopterin-guanine dinucleotide biosynthesis protein A
MSPPAIRSTRLADDGDTLAVIILAGGRSLRMGCPKPWLDFGGRSLLARVVERSQPWADEVVIVAAPDQTLPLLAVAGVDPEEPPVRIVRDHHPGEGPLPALALGLATITAPWAVAIGCDAPLVRRGVLARLARERSEADAVMPLWDGRPQPLVALYRRTLAPALDALVAGGERRLHAIATLPRVRLVPSEELHALDPDGESFRCLNTPDEYAAALAAWRAARDGGRLGLCNSRHVSASPTRSTAASKR